MKLKSFPDLAIYLRDEMLNQQHLTNSQKSVIQYIDLGWNVFITGVAGTGKTWLLKKLSDLSGKPVELFATSGMTAINLGGVTVSSNEALGLYGYEETNEHIKQHNEKGRYSPGTIIVIDEIGFLSIEQFHQIDYTLRCIGDEDEFCGGFQMVIAGDFRQMPPMYWGTPLDNSKILKNFQEVELVECVRQKDDLTFFNQLMKVRTEGITPEVKDFLSLHHNSDALSGPIITATRSLMDELNSSIEVPVDFKQYSCIDEDENRLYESIKLWEGMPLIICANSTKKGYANGDMGTVVWFSGDENEDDDFDYDDENDDDDDDEYVPRYKVAVRLERTQEIVYVDFHTKSYSVPLLTQQEDEDGVMREVCIKQKKLYEYMPILPVYYLSIRRVQGLTLQSGILHNSIVEAKNHSEDFVNIQYVALSRFEKINQCHIQGLQNQMRKAI